ncbi:LuxR C-terminal-related transcriptional regulator [Streptomyces sp. NBC_01142]|uniref:LuxR C-terminal-related transcriptional regulator n=1 Tax=Streptomyces sp. NBC_01142 TaxID=2975865 RepID=UPI0022594312|nr:LuxR C-terminal-related transcriptional regulator [Streptomyces sp. NBC_01142]MCX4820181.1 LuxR C-terminal-related transcriptional regulator [Streptomyces sp. NBC_01142]
MSERPSEPGVVYPVPPTAAAVSVFRPLKAQMDQYCRTERSLRAAFAQFDAVYDETRRQEEPAFTLLVGSTAIGDTLEAAVDACREELLTAQPGGGRPVEHLVEALDRDMRLLSRGTHQRTIYQHTVRAHQPTLAYIEQVVAAGAEVRTLAEVFERVIICDRKVAFIPVSDDRGAAALEVRHPAVVRFLAQTFDRDWARCIPVDEQSVAHRSPAVISDTQRTILQAIVAGETDESIARRLGMSRRSVAVHVRRVSEQLGSRSRGQLGYLIATSGVLDDNPG